MKNILVPIDFSKQSIEALKVAVELAKKTKAKLRIIHVVFTPILHETGIAGEPVLLNPTFAYDIEREVFKKFDKAISKIKPAVHLKLEVLYGDIASSIIESIIRYKNDLVVIGSSGTTGSGWMIGSITEKIVRHSGVPVLTVWKSLQASRVKDILLPSTLELNQMDFVKKIKILQEIFKAKLHILYVNTPLNFITDKEARELFAEFIKHYKITNCKTYLRNERSEEEGIMNFAYSQRMNLIAMATHARKGLSHLVSGSVTEDVVEKVTIPVWTYCLKKSE